MKLLYYCCVAYEIWNLFLSFYQMLKNGYKNCDTTASKIGTVLGRAFALAVRISTIYFLVTCFN